MWELHVIFVEKSTMIRREQRRLLKYIKGLGQKSLKVRNNLQDVGIDGRIIVF